MSVAKRKQWKPAAAWDPTRCDCYGSSPTLKQLVGSVAIAIQRGNVMTFLAGHSRALAAEGRKEDEVRGG